MLKKQGKEIGLDTSQRDKSAFRELNFDYVVLIVYSLLVHGLLLVNDGIFWDGWLVYTHHLEKDWGSLSLMFTEAGGIPITFYFHRLFSYFPWLVFSYRLVAFFSVMFSGILVYIICREVKMFRGYECLLLALLCLSYPAFQVSIELITTPTVFYYCLFLLACYLAIKSETTSGIRMGFLRICSLCLFILSFPINSLLVLYYGFLFVLVIHSCRYRRIAHKKLFTKFMPRRLDYLLLPIIFWVISRLVFPSHGLYSNYNRIIFSLSSLVGLHINFINNCVYEQVRIALQDLIEFFAYYFPFGLGVFMVFLIGTQWIYKRLQFQPVHSVDRKVGAYSLLLFGIALLFLGIFPYAAVGKVASIHGWDTRHALLIPLPMAMIFVGAIRLTFSQAIGSISRLGFTSLIILVFAFSLSTVKNYIAWQARWVKDRSIMANLSRMSDAKKLSVLWVDDQFPIGGEGFYRFYEWASIFKSVWSDESHIGLDRRGYSKEFLIYGQRYFNRRYNLADFDPAGCQGILTVRRGPLSLSNAKLSLQYLFRRFFHKEGLSPFLYEVTELQLQVSSDSEAVCFANE
jgi:hypothetical protein